jgi:predicted DNA-binding transcriptional regulator AlpA
MPDTSATGPVRHHLDRRAADLAAAGAGNPDDLLSTSDLAEWLGVSVQWVEIGRSKGWSPPFIKLSPRRIRYRRESVLEWLRARSFVSTSEYETGHGPGRPRKAPEAADA